MQHNRKGKVMGMQQKTRQIVETSISRKENFERGNVWGKWFKPNHFHNVGQIGWMNQEFADMLSKHSKDTNLFVLYSYYTPMAWFRLSDLDSKGNNKWYFPDGNHASYSPSTGQHQYAFRYALRGQNVVTLTSDNDGNVTETEHEYYGREK